LVEHRANLASLIVLVGSAGVLADYFCARVLYEIFFSPVFLNKNPEVSILEVLSI